jgi:uncharacterized SAM-binding protein YcdF (DUF218 family)
MWHTLSKILPYLFYPLTIVLVLLILAATLLASGRQQRLAAGTLMAAIILLLVASAPPVAGVLYGTLERIHPPLAIEDVPVADAIVVLGGGIDLPLHPRTDAELGEAADRILVAARLYRAGKAPRVLVSGGNVFAQDGVAGESEYTRRLLVEWGVPTGMIVVETRSRNTYQNAIETRKLLTVPGRWKVLLVTSAVHMPRALATYRSQAIDAVPVPTDYAVVGYNQPWLLDWLPSAQALSMSTAALREWLGLAVYRARGWIAPESDRKH